MFTNKADEAIHMVTKELADINFPPQLLPTMEDILEVAEVGLRMPHN